MAQDRSGAEISWNNARASRRRWSIGIAFALCVLFILVFAMIVTDRQDGTNTGPGSWPRKVSIPYGFKFDLGAPSQQTSWTDITFQLSSGVSTIAWMNLTAEDLNSKEKNETWHFGHPQILGSLSVWLNVTDLAGNGRIDNGDYLAITTGSDSRFSSNTTYTLTLLYEPTDGSMLSYDFTG